MIIPKICSNCKYYKKDEKTIPALHFFDNKCSTHYGKDAGSRIDVCGLLEIEKAGGSVELSEFGNLLTKEKRINDALLEQVEDWDVMQQITDRLNMNPSDCADLCDSLLVATAAWISRTGWGEMALELRKELYPTEEEQEAAEREALEDEAYLCREWARMAT